MALCAAAGCGSGGGPAPLLPVEQSADLGIVRADVPTELVVFVPNPLDKDADVAESGPPGPPFSDAPGMVFGAVAAGTSLEVRLVVSPSAPGSYETTVGLLFTEGSRSREVLLTVTAVAEEARVEAPSRIDLGDVLEGDERSAVLTVHNPNAATPITIGPADPLPEGFSLAGLDAPRALAPGESAALSLTYAARAMGVHDFDLLLHHSLAAEPLATRVTATTKWGRIYVDFGDVPFASGMTDWLEVDVPEDAISLTIEADSPGNPVQLLGLEGPNGDAYKVDRSAGALRWNGFATFAVTVPNTDRPEVQLKGGGTYRFRLACPSTTSLPVRAIVQTRPGAIADSGILDLNVFLAAGLGIADPEADAKLQGTLAYADGALGQVGLRFGKVSYFTLDPVYDEVSNTEFSSLYKSSSVAPEVRMNVFITREIWIGYLGIAGQIDGQARNGTYSSGVIIDLDPFSAKEAGRSLAHEICHYLGLTHTVEASGGHDDILDTLECPASGTDAVCTEEGAGYLMHWLFLGGDRNVITDGQARVVLGHPLVRPGIAAPAAPASLLGPEDAGAWSQAAGMLCGTTADAGG